MKPTKEEMDNWDRDMGDHKKCPDCKQWVIPLFTAGPNGIYEMTCPCGGLLDEDKTK